MILSPLFYIISIFMLGRKLNSIFVSVKEKNMGKTKVEIFFLSLMLLTIALVYFTVKKLNEYS